MDGQSCLGGCQGYLQSDWQLLRRLGELQCQGTFGGGMPLNRLLEQAHGHHWVLRIQSCVGCREEGGDWYSARVPLFQVADVLPDYHWRTYSCKDVRQMEAEGETVDGSGHTGRLGLCPKGHTSQN